VYFKDRGWLKTDVYERSDLPAEASFKGPAVVEEPTATTLLPPGHGVSVDDYGNLVIKAT
jgi:N-methylhydantoinase A